MTGAAVLPIVAVHGFMFDPEDAGGPNDPAGFFTDMSAVVGRPVWPFAWYSAPFGLRLGHPVKSTLQTARAWLGAWGHGHLHPYRYAWALARRAAEDFAAAVAIIPGAVDVLAHSLGSRVVLQALERHLPPGKVRNLVLFNGAELARNATEAAMRTDAQVLNIVVGCDRALGLLGSRFSGDRNGPCVGSVGLSLPTPNWRDLRLDDPVTVRNARLNRGWTLRGDDPRDLLDHFASYRFPGNADVVRAWLRGDRLRDLTEGAEQPASAGALWIA